MAISQEWAGLPVSPTLPYLGVPKVCLMHPGNAGGRVPLPLSTYIYVVLFNIVLCYLLLPGFSFALEINLMVWPTTATTATASYVNVYNSLKIYIMYFIIDSMTMIFFIGLANKWFVRSVCNAFMWVRT